jgi:hypothetical protein
MEPEMSSRVRIFYYNPNFPGVHTGNNALKALEKSYSQTPGQLIWRRADTSPRSIDSVNPNMRRREGSDGRYIYEVPETIPSLLPVPADLKGIDRASWIWAHYPDTFKRGAIFEIVRESRSRSWSRQQANPWNHGLGKQRPKKKRLGRQSRSWQDLATARVLAMPATPRRILRDVDDEAPEPVDPGAAPRLRLGIWA